jgi:hypothetical protein
VPEGDPVAFAGTAIDAEDGDVSASLAWVSDLDGAIGTGAGFTTSTLSVGLHTITASVTDSGGRGASDQIALSINGPTPPVVTLTAPANGSSAVEGDPVTFAGAATDAEDGDLTANLAWVSDLDGAIGTGAGFTTSGLSLGLHTITASVTDSGGLPGSDQIALTINVNTPPVVTLTAPADGSSAVEGAPVTFAGTATDAEDGDLTANLAWASDLDGAIGSGAGFTTSGLSIGLHTITASVTDSGSLPGGGQITLTINANTPPVVTLTAPADGSSAIAGAPVTFAGTATDAEEGNLSASLGWVSDLDGAIGAGAGFTTSGLSVGLHTITAAVSDSGGLPGSDQIALTINANTPPAVTLTAPADGANATEGDPVTFAGTATDAEDGDLTANLAWVSDLDGAIGTGAGFTTSGLSVGAHTITASVTDSGSLPGSDQLALIVIASTTEEIFEKRIDVSADDAEEGPRGGVSLTSSDLELVDDQTVGIRFIDVGVPSGATVLEAYVQFQADETGSGAVSLTLAGGRNGLGRDLTHARRRGGRSRRALPRREWRNLLQGAHCCRCVVEPRAVAHEGRVRPGSADPRPERGDSGASGRRRRSTATPTERRCCTCDTGWVAPDAHGSYSIATTYTEKLPFGKPVLQPCPPQPGSGWSNATRVIRRHEPCDLLRDSAVPGCCQVPIESVVVGGLEKGRGVDQIDTLDPRC